MPLYDYQCSQCRKVLEVRHGFDERYEQPCDACGGALVRVIGPAPIIFKGSGFYVTDSRKKDEARRKDETRQKDAPAPAAEGAKPPPSSTPPSPSTPAPAPPASPSKESAA